MAMRALSTERRAAVVSILLIAAVILVTVELMLENTVPGTWASLCEIEDLPNPDEIIQVGDVIYLAKENETIRVFKSHDGCNWFEIESPASDHDMWSYSIALFRVPGDILGIAWEETDPDPDKKPRSTFFWSTFNGSTWSEPEILFHRDVYCTLNDAVMLEDGALLLMWKEPLVQYIRDGDKTIEFTGCRIVYRAYVGKDEFLIEQVIEPENPFSCHTSGYSFVDDGNHIWCVFEHGENTYSFYRSWSEDGRQWSPPESFSVHDSTIEWLLLTPQGEIGLFDYYFEDENLFLLKSTDWESWSEEKIFRTEKDVFGGFHLAGGKNETMWGLIVTGDSTLFIQPSQESGQEYQETMQVVNVLNCLVVACIVLIAVLTLSWIWKRL